MSRPHACPICKKDAALPPENKRFPFCSVRCQNIDLAKWFGEEYRITSDGTDRNLRPQPPELELDD